MRKIIKRDYNITDCTFTLVHGVPGALEVQDDDELKVLSGTTQIASCFLRLDHLLDAPSIDGLQERSSQETIISEHGVLG